MTDVDNLIKTVDQKELKNQFSQANIAIIIELDNG